MDISSRYEELYRTVLSEHSAVFEKQDMDELERFLLYDIIILLEEKLGLTHEQMAARHRNVE